MRNFFEEKYTNLEFKRELINIISKISEYKGAISAYQTQNQRYLIFWKRVYHCNILKLS